MNACACLWPAVLVFAQVVQLPAPSSNERCATSGPSADQLLRLYRREVSDYEIYRDAERREKLDLNQNSICSWTNPSKDALAQGVLFVWTYRGCAEVVGGAWSHPQGARRAVFHEFNSLSRRVLKPTRASGGFVWSPQAAVARLTIADAEAPAESSRKRLLQLRALAREFSAHSTTPDRQRWELRVLANPLFRYESTDDELLDGGVFAFVSSAGTDPEVLMVIEATKGDDPRWQCAFGRLSVYDTFVERAGRTVWSSVWTSRQASGHTATHDAEHTFEVYRDKMIDELPVDRGDAGAQNEERPSAGSSRP
ncbi:MAG TPA: hypothetical protein VG826_00900 [Pirellulales bacterium]|nr:hypothetical protein [Pirellulales bacterium]